MKHRHFFLLAIFAVTIAINSCKKDPATNPDSGIIPSDADGAFYIDRSVSNAVIGFGYDTAYYASAWFGNGTHTQTVGSVTANNTPLMETPLTGIANGLLYYNTHANVYGSNTKWSVAGDSALGIPSFNYIDSVAFPPVPMFTLPNSVSLNNTLVVTFSEVAIGTSEIICNIWGEDSIAGNYSKTINTNSTNISFTPAELIQAGAISGNQLGVTITSIEYIGQTIGSKKYYFVKENTYTAFTTTY